jgi:hypothetical protein
MYCMVFGDRPSACLSLRNFWTCWGVSFLNWYLPRTGFDVLADIHLVASCRAGPVPLGHDLRQPFVQKSSDRQAM